MLSEEAIIQKLQKIYPSIGDDAAVLPLTGTKKMVISKDLLIEDVHFRRKYGDPISLAHKALECNISDIAAMGAKTTQVLLGISVPNNAEHYINTFLEYFVNNCQTHNITLIGGDTTRSPDKLIISVTAMGIIDEAYIKFRKGAAIGNIICVTGPLGYSHLGLQAFEQGIEDLLPYKQAFLTPTARQEEGLWLGSQTSVTAMMDISDGLYIDLHRLCEASQVAAEITLDALTSSDAFNAACYSIGLEPIKTQLIGGEDYGLLICVDPNDTNFLKNFSDNFGYALLPIGKITKGETGEILFKKNNKPVHLDIKPFSHFYYSG